MELSYFANLGGVPPSCPFGIFVNQAGYTPDSVKKAVLPMPCDRFELVDMEGVCHYEGQATYFGPDACSGDHVSMADFSDFTQEGVYRITASGAQSAAFRIAKDVYAPVFDDVMKAYYFLRCGCGLDEAHAGVYQHAPCHTQSALLWEDRHVSMDVSGGWHDAGDYGRYVTPGACALAHLLYAYKLYPDVFQRQHLNLPESGGPLPDLLAECRWELEWLLKMQRADGAVYHKVTTQRHAPFVMPQDDTAPLYVFPVSSMATADFAAVCALASGVYAPYDAGFSQRLRDAAEKTGVWLVAHPEFIGFTNPEGCNTGGYGQRNDDSNRFWAWAELYALTGDAQMHQRMLASLSQPFPLVALGYGETGGLGALAYLLCNQEKDEAIVQRMKEQFLSEAQRLQAVADACGYGCAMQERDYHWGSSMTLLTHGMIFALCDTLMGSGHFRRYAQAQLDTLLGVNALGISLVTGTGEFCCNHPHLRPAYADGIEACMPGMVSGWANRGLQDRDAQRLIAPGTPPMKCYADHVGCYSLNEITIYWNSPAVFLLAYLRSPRQVIPCENRRDAI